MSHEFETGMFARGLAAWHKLGTVLPKGHAAEMDAHAAMRAAGCDWTVSMRQTMIKVDSDLGSIVHSTRDVAVPGVRAIVRDSDNRILGNAGDVPCAEAKARYQYRPYQNAEMADWFQPMLDNGMAKIDAVASLYGGQRVYMLARIGHNGDSHAEIVPGDDVANHWLLANSHDGRHSLRVARCRTRVVCANTLAAAFGEGTNVRLRHTGSMVQSLDDLRKVMVKEQEAFSEDVNVFRTLAKRQVTSKMLREYVQSVFPESFKEKKETAAEKRQREYAEIRARRQNDTHPTIAQHSKSMIDDLLGGATAPAEETFAEQRAELCSDILDRVSELVECGRGTDIPGVRGTMWGAMNSVAEYLQYEYGRGPKGISDKRMDSMVFGAPATWNALALQKAIAFGK